MAPLAWISDSLASCSASLPPPAFAVADVGVDGFLPSLRVPSLADAHAPTLALS